MTKNTKRIENVERKEKELVKICEERNIVDEKSEVCKKCKHQETLTVEDIMNAPKNCPRLKDFNKVFDPLVSLSQAIEPLTLSLSSLGDMVKEFERASSMISLASIEPLELASVRPHLTQTELKLLDRINKLDNQLKKANKEIATLRAIIKEMTSKKEIKYIR